MISKLKPFINIGDLSAEIESQNATLIVVKTLTGELIADDVYTIRNGSKSTIMIGNDVTGYKELSIYIEEKIVVSYGLLNE